ncbi:MAG: acetyltransferase [Planctomycetaceae bacterium]|jgi:sugar O-acyltransferase (sialic acid O-acetyltransferase NeuD family)
MAITPESKHRLVIIGGGGHARVVIEAINASADPPEICGLLDSDRSLWLDEVGGVTVLGGDDQLPRLREEYGCDSFAVAIGGVGSFELRKMLFNRACAAGLHPWTVRHPSSECSASAEIAAGCQLLTRSVINSGARVRKNVIVNTAAVVEHDCNIQEHVHIAPLACLAGGVHVGAETHIGTGATVLENLTIGSRSIIGAGAVVVTDVPNDSVFVGVPARPLKKTVS